MKKNQKFRDGSTKALVAELLSQDLDREQIQARLGITRNAFNARVGDIRRDLGWQSS